VTRNPIRLKARTVPGPVRQGAAALGVSERVVNDLLAFWEQADRECSAAEARAADIEKRLMPEERWKEHEKNAAELEKAVAKIREAAAKVVRDHKVAVQRAPYMRREGAGWIDTREAQRDLSPSELLLRELQDSRRWDFLRGFSEAERGAVLRRLAEGDDPDGVLAAAERAPSFLNLIDGTTRERITEARLRRNGMAENLERSAFVASAYQHLDATIAEALRAFGAPEDRTLQRTMPDGSMEPLA
jgi:hypothetical protein